MSQVLIHEPRPEIDECRDWLAGEGHDVVVCRDREDLLSALALRRPDLVVYVLEEQRLDLRVLSLVRRLAPTLPIIVLAAPSGLELRRAVQELRPTYYGVLPLEPTELAEAVRCALEPHDARG